jgi:hypothetical protein
VLLAIPPDGSPGCGLDVWETPPRTDSYIHPYAKRGRPNFKKPAQPREALRVMESPPLGIPFGTHPVRPCAQQRLDRFSGRTPQFDFHYKQWSAGAMNTTEPQPTYCCYISKFVFDRFVLNLIRLTTLSLDTRTKFHHKSANTFGNETDGSDCPFWAKNKQGLRINMILQMSSLDFFILFIRPFRHTFLK